MTIALLIIAHDTIGETLLKSAEDILGPNTLNTATLAIFTDTSLEEAHRAARQQLDLIHGADGTLVLSDLFGSTPSNVACHLQRPGEINVVTGLNLPMLIKVLSHADDGLARVTELAIRGGQEGILPGRAQSIYPPTPLKAVGQ